MPATENAKSWALLMQMEDHLQNNHVFKNGFTQQPCHSDSYMTLVDFAALDVAFATSEFSPADWAYGCEYWTTNENMQPPLRLVGLTIARKLKKASA